MTTKITAWLHTQNCNKLSLQCRTKGYTATSHQREVGTGYFDEVSQTISGGTSSTTAMTGSTETAQFV